MKITNSQAFKEKLLQKIADREFQERTGVHQSDLIYCLNKQVLRKLKPAPNTERELLLFSLGWATQRWLTGQDKDEPEKEVDGIIVTCDAMSGIDEGVVPWELKCTFQSSGKPIEENTHWIRQLMAQCYVTGTTTAYLSRLEVMGGWTWVWNMRAKPEKIAKLVAEKGENWDAHPTLSVIKVEFAQDELDRFWAWLKERRDLYLEILSSEKLVAPAYALASGMTFECDYCSYREKECQEGM